MSQSQQNKIKDDEYVNPKLEEYNSHILHFMGLRKLTLARILSTLVVGKIVKKLTIKRIKFWWETVTRSNSKKLVEKSSRYYEIFDYFAENHDLILLDSEISDIIKMIDEKRPDHDSE